MLNPKNFKGPPCSKWKELNTMNFNYFDSQKKENKTKSPKELKTSLLELKKEKKVAINAGHFIPNNDNWEDIGKNPKKTWQLGCELIETLKNNNLKAKISLMLNDIDLTTEARGILFNKQIEMPKSFLEIMKKSNLSKKNILHCGWNNEEIFTEKKLSNRLDHLIKRKKIDEKYKNARNYCVSALTMYFLDLLDQKIDISIMIIPKCAWANYKKAVDFFEKTNKGELKHICYLETPNCFL